MDTSEEGEWSTAGGVEHKLEYTEVYNLFLEHFEDKISGAIKSNALPHRRKKQLHV